MTHFSECAKTQLLQLNIFTGLSAHVKRDMLFEVPLRSLTLFGGKMPIKSISPGEVYQLRQNSSALSIIDVREKDEFAAVSSPLATNFPLSSFDINEIARKYDAQAPLFLLCRSGKRSMRAAEILQTQGFNALYNIEGGMIEWEASGLPVVRE